MSEQSNVMSKAAFFNRLVEKFPNFDPAWPDAVKQQWFENYNQLVDRAIRQFEENPDF